MPTNIGSGYEVQFVDGVLQQRLIGTSLWSTIAVNVTEARHSVGAGLGSRDPSDIGVGWKGPWCYPSDPSSQIVFTSTRTDLNFEPVDQYFFEPRTPASFLQSLYLTYSVEIPHVITATAPAPSSPVSTIEATLSMSGHQIIDGLPATLPSGFVVLSQLTELSQAITTVINAGDAANATSIANLAQVVANLPSGITLEQVQSAIDTKVAEAVLAEVIDDAQAQAIVDAALASLANLDQTVLGRLTTAEADIDALEPRITVAEGQIAGQSTAINALNDGQLLQDQAITGVAASVTNQGLTIAAQAARLGTVESDLLNLNSADVALANRTTSAEAGLTSLVAAMTPISVSIMNGGVFAVTSIALSNIVVASLNSTHQSVSITLPAAMSGSDRTVVTSRQAANGSFVECICSVVKNGDTYVVSGLKEWNGMSLLKIDLNFAGLINAA